MSLVTVPMRRLLVFVSFMSVTLLVGIMPAFAEEAVEGGDATHNVEAMETQTSWFYWPGWAFGALTLLVIALVGFAWYKSVLGPKYRGKKVTS